ncbi:hypothetical protein MYY11_002547 [Enterococcus faecium]|nr:hypothetical protein [Enterococcus faecium]
MFTNEYTPTAEAKSVTVNYVYEQSNQAQTVMYVYKKREGEDANVNCMDKNGRLFLGMISDNHKSAPKTYPRIGENLNVSILFLFQG